jgi:hypothetical protein
MSKPLTMKDLQKQINELKAELSEIKKEKIPAIKKKLEIGDNFELAGLNWKILDITEKGYICLADKLEDESQCDSDSNDWKESSLRSYLNGEFLGVLREEIGEENILSFERDLLSLDGLDEYGKCEDYVSLLNVDEYRKYRKHIPNTDYYWWLLTADSVKSNGDNRWVRIVLPSGYFYVSSCHGVSGVRPVCIFSSLIFESEE